MGSCPVDDDRHRGLQTNLLTIQKTSGQLLPNIELNHGEVRRVSYNPVGGSTMFDIWEGEYLGQERCAIKVVRGIQNDAPKVRERFLQEVTIWRKVWEIDKGEYILPFWGACLTDGPYPYIVSPWMPYGDAITYVNKYPYVNRKRIIRRIAEGLKILHTYAPPITHGDIKGSNFLIDEKGNPLLSDFGLRKMIEDLTGMPFTQSQGMSESYRWFAPELCYAPGVLSLESDIYAYSMTVLEARSLFLLMTGKEPFLHIRRTPEVLIKMQQGERPRKPEGPEIIQRGLDDKLWDLLTRCWVEDPAARPSIHEVIAELQDD
ncbi:kinase-like protein [Fomitiporia mediterranea MF3/22]|uniref:kinase-like protein n=1 Tax=Fomitiporia mediterranea (strain MF3/22) TaxID=694068 RepID=UPI0004407455|nr:kinase-like protein [Fomitiporia mediterranea MF3/22]EJD03397.1 kinase-like protein [Fomitiporia mediterranea MF3/22]